jgi:hypothetical protein
MTSDLEARLQAALKADAAPARDPMFRVQTLQRHERALFRRQLLAFCALILVAALSAALGLEALARPSAGALTAVAAAAALAGFLAARHMAGVAAVLSRAGIWRAGVQPGALMPRLWR